MTSWSLGTNEYVTTIISLFSICSLHFTPYLSNTPTNLCMALLTFSLFCFVLYCYAFVQYCNVNTIQYNAMHKFVRVLDNPLLHCPSLLQFVKLLVVSVVCCWLTFKQSNEKISGGAVPHFHTNISHCPFRCLLLRVRKIVIFLFNLSLVEPRGVPGGGTPL